MPTNTIDIIWNAATSVAPLGFVPVAIHFCLFDALVELDRPVKGQELLDAFPEKFCGRQTTASPKLLDDTLFAMTALSWVELVDGNRYKANDTTRHLARTPSALHGVLHFATEILFSSAFLMRKLQASDFEYPFAGLDTPMQFAYRAMGNDRLAQMHTYDIMAEEGRIASFNTFMQGKLGNERTMPERLTLLGYDLASVVEEARGQGQPVTMVDVGGGRGDMMLQVKEAIPGLEEKDLIVEECNPDITAIPGLSLVVWDYNAKNSPQPVEGALVYHLAGVFHNLPDLDAVRLLRKLSEAMAPYSRVLVHERRKAAVPGSHAAMVVLYGGRERSVEEWNELVELAGLQVTFYAFPDDRGLGVVEMRKKSISFWPETLTSGDRFSFSPIPLVRPPPVTITNDPNPESSSGVTHSPVTRTITPYPYPTDILEEDDDDDGDDDDNHLYGGPFPSVTITDGPPGPKCTSGCGEVCEDCGEDPDNLDPPPVNPDDPDDPEDPDDLDDPDNPDDDDDDDDDEDEDDGELSCPFPDIDVDAPDERLPRDDEEPDIRTGEYPGPAWDPDEGDVGDGEPTRSLEIYYVNFIDKINNSMGWWFIDRAHDGGTIHVCEEENDAGDCGGPCEAPGDEDDLENPPWPDGEWEMTKGDAARCVYKSDGSGPGILSCDGQDEMECEVTDKAEQEVLECPPIEFRLDFFFTIYCYHN